MHIKESCYDRKIEKKNNRIIFWDLNKEHALTTEEIDDENMITDDEGGKLTENCCENGREKRYAGGKAERHSDGDGRDNEEIGENRNEGEATKKVDEDRKTE